jgi:hypothetical protein
MMRRSSMSADQGNREFLEQVFEKEGIELKRGRVFDASPPPMPRNFDFARAEGMMLGLAIGDALGNTSEGLLPCNRQAQHGEIRDYLPNRYAEMRPAGVPSDDTQLAFWTLEQLIADKGFVPEHVAQRFCRGRIFGLSESGETTG